MLACREREAMVIDLPPTCDSAVSPCFHGCLAFLHRHFPPQSPPSHPLNLSLESIAALAWDCSTIPKTTSPSWCAFQVSSFPVRGMYGCGKDCLIVIPFRLPQISCSTLSLKCFFSNSGNCPNVVIGPLLQFPYLLIAGPVPLTFLIFPLVPSSYLVLCGPIYSFCCAGTTLCSQLVFCMYFCVWRCVPDVSMERDALHVHLFLRHLRCSLLLLLSCFVQLFVTRWTATHQASLSFTISWSLLKLNAHWVSDAIQPPHPLSSPSPPAFNLSQGLILWIGCLHQVAKVLDLKHQSFQWVFRFDFL